LKRVKRRYLALQLDTEGLPGQKEFIDAVWYAVTRFYGEYGASMTSMALIDYDVEQKVAIVRTNLTTVDNLRTALASITSILGKQAAVHVIGVSGTIKALCVKLRE
jgi:ribonuclease P/MRP protein subunit POP5